MTGAAPDAAAMPGGRAVVTCGQRPAVAGGAGTGAAAAGGGASPQAEGRAWGEFVAGSATVCVVEAVLCNSVTVDRD